MPTEQDESSHASTHQDICAKYLKSRITRVQGVSPCDDVDAIQLARQKGDDGIAVHHNAHSPICGLPFELLGRIFHLHSASDPPGDASALGWIQATHVCRFWRDTALQHAGLWTDVTDRLGKEWAKEMLVRSKSVPISYSQRSESSTAVGPPNNAIAGPAVSEQLFRIRHLSIAEPTRSMNTTLKSMMTSPAPILESLCLEDTHIKGLDEARIFLPDRVFKAHCPMLRRLELKDIMVHWSAPILRHLTHLFIVKTCFEAFIDSDINVYIQFFCALREMTSLETLRLSFCLPVEHGDSSDVQTVVLPRVEKLELCSPLMDECSGILRHLKVLPSCDVAIECGQILPGPLDEIFSFARARAFTSPPQPPFLTMFLSTALEDGFDYPDPGLQLRFWTASRARDLAGFHRNWENIPCTSILVERSPEDESFPLVCDVSLLCKSSPWDIIRNLIIGSDGEPDWILAPENWVYIFDQYTQVENLSVMGEAAQSLCVALGISMPLLQLGEPAEGEDGRQLSKEELFLEKLKCVGFHEVDFRGEYNRGESEGEDRAVGTNAYSLLRTSLFRRRSASAAPLALAITRCSIDPDQIRGLQEVAWVYWDLVEDSFREDELDVGKSDDDTRRGLNAYGGFEGRNMMLKTNMFNHYIPYVDKIRQQVPLHPNVICVLALEVGQDHPRGEWHPRFDPWTAVERLEFARVSASWTLLKAATPNVEEQTVLLFPRLKNLVFYGQIRPNGGAALEHLLRLAENRNTAGTPIEIDSSECAWCSAHSKTALQKVARVTWDGAEWKPFLLDNLEQIADEENRGV